MLHALRAASLTARITRLGDPPHDHGQIQVEMPIKGRSRFAAIAERDWPGRMTGRWGWDGHETDAGRQRYRRALRCDAYARMVGALRHGRPGVQADLFCHAGWPSAPWCPPSLPAQADLPKLTCAAPAPSSSSACLAGTGHPGKA